MKAADMQIDRLQLDKATVSAMIGLGVEGPGGKGAAPQITRDAKGNEAVVINGGIHITVPKDMQLDAKKIAEMVANEVRRQRERN